MNLQEAREVLASASLPVDVEEAADIVLAEVERLTAEREQLEKALLRIEKWHGEFPDSGSTWDDGTPMSYGAAFGSNGERDYMRDIASAALAKG